MGMFKSTGFLYLPFFHCLKRRFILVHQWRNTVIINLQLLLPRSFSSAIDSNHAGSITLGQFTLEEVERIKALDSANLKSDSLTCQPRVFSLLGNSFSPHTTISFALNRSAHVTTKVMA